MIRVLHIVGSLGHAGLEAVVMNYYRNIDANKFQFDFVVGSPSKQKYDDEILARGGHIYRIQHRTRHPFKYAYSLYRLVKKNRYQIIHIHQNSASMVLEALVARLCGLKIIIGHSHNTSCQVLWQHYILKPFVNLLVTDRFACSREAGNWVFGKRNDITILFNAIDFERFCFNSETRFLYRTQLGLDPYTVIGFVGRLEDVKNPIRLFEIFQVICRSLPDSKLLIVGDGELRPQLEHMAKSFGIEKQVIFTGKRNDIPQLLCSMDAFVMPSKHEGLSVAMVEAQASGLPCILSSNIPFVDITHNIYPISLDSSNDTWANTIISAIKTSHRLVDKKEFVSSGYSIDIESQKLVQFYTNRLLEQRHNTG